MSVEGELEPGDRIKRLLAAARRSEQQLVKVPRDVEGPREAHDRRNVVERAKSLLMAQYVGMSADGAFEIMVKASQRENVKVRDIAQRIVDRRLVSED